MVLKGLSHLRNGMNKMFHSGVFSARGLTRAGTQRQCHSLMSPKSPSTDLFLTPPIKEMFTSTTSYESFRDMVVDGNLGIIDVTFDVGRPVTLHFNSNDPALPLDSTILSKDDVTNIWTSYAQQYHRDRLVIPNTVHRMSCLRDIDGYISGLTLRLSHATPDIHTRGVWAWRAPCTGRRTSCRAFSYNQYTDRCR